MCCADRLYFLHLLFEYFVLHFDARYLLLLVTQRVLRTKSRQETPSRRGGNAYAAILSMSLYLDVVEFLLVNLVECQLLL